MAYTTVNKSTDYFNPKLYTGNSGTNAISSVGFKPDFTWLKVRDGTTAHYLFDAVRGVTKQLNSNTTNAENTGTTSLTAFGSDGFTLGSETEVNNNSYSYVSWNWKANGQGSSNTAGSINTTYTSANTTSGFSIVSYTGTGSAGATVGHGLGVAPSMIIARRLNGVEDWGVYHKTIGASKYIILNTTAAAPSGNDTSRWGGVTPTNNVFTLGDHASVNASGGTHIAYCFAEKQGYSKFGSYIGNDNGNGPFIYTGFKPAFVMIKRKDGTGNWSMIDNKRSSFNECNNTLRADLNSAEYTATDQSNDMLSNGFKIRNNADNFNVNNSTYIYMAFAEAPLVGSNNVPCTAR